ncbi:MAG: hypothetical protein F6J98_30060 [Moorea sp. SIO4G2]|uniref:hypothetical protein n=1 Tax=unclassified Moorena TaxID=2683338 RepID=UPI0013FAB247|nr:MULTISPECIES: hypothetical protein [unclassified Moorena]NEO17479.1 hypothetical protein [Moorena sp. SIO3E8]NEO64426.1 hypothetical protein [Moorena sp. SIO4G2]NEQ04063.1 hypothetical protein [Moorena sp. SIO3F7]NEQ63643.1 hypothetical protein [Moorena sp. SIO4A1]
MGGTPKTALPPQDRAASLVVVFRLLAKFVKALRLFKIIYFIIWCCIKTLKYESAIASKHSAVSCQPSAYFIQKL